MIVRPYSASIFGARQTSSTNKTRKLLHGLARIELRAEDRESIRACAGCIADWEEVWQQADKEGIAGLVFHHLQRENLLPHLPASAAARFEKEYLESAQKTLQIHALAASLSDRLQSNRIPVMALQGLTVAGLYGDPGLRPMFDFDLMVHPEDLPCFRSFLLDAGYRMPDPRFPELFARHGVALDLHTHLLNLDRIRSRRYLFPENLDPLWEASRPLPGRLGRLLAPDPCDNLIALAAHALKHGYSRLIWLVDIHESLRHLEENGLDWDRLFNRAHLWKQERPLFYALNLIQKILGASVPGSISQPLGIRSLGGLERILLAFAAKDRSSSEIAVALQMGLIPGVTAKWQFIRETLVPRRTVMNQVYQQAPHRVKRLDGVRRAGEAMSILGRNLGRFVSLFHDS